MRISTTFTEKNVKLRNSRCRDKCKKLEQFLLM